jgi:hypothetical protein
MPILLHYSGMATKGYGCNRVRGLQEREWPAGATAPFQRSQNVLPP